MASPSAQAEACRRMEYSRRNFERTPLHASSSLPMNTLSLLPPLLRTGVNRIPWQHRRRKLAAFFAHRSGPFINHDNAGGGRMADLFACRHVGTDPGQPVMDFVSRRSWTISGRKLRRYRPGASGLPLPAAAGQVHPSDHPTANSANTTHTSPASPTSATSDSASPSAMPVCIV